MMTDAYTPTAQHAVLATPIGELTVVREGDLLTAISPAVLAGARTPRRSAPRWAATRCAF